MTILAQALRMAHIQEDTTSSCVLLAGTTLISDVLLHGYNVELDEEYAKREILTCLRGVSSNRWWLSGDRRPKFGRNPFEKEPSCTLKHTQYSVTGTGLRRFSIAVYTATFLMLETQVHVQGEMRRRV